MGLLLDRDKLTTKNIESALHELLENPKYLSNARSISKMILEKPDKANDTFIHWLEFTARNPGLGRVLKLPGAELSPFYYYCGDILLLVFCILFIILHTVLRTINLPSRKIKSE